MAPNCKEKLPISECAAPFTDEPNEKTVPELSFVEAGTSAEYVSLRREETEDRDSNVRVTTASYSYELDRYHKNAMLIFHISSYEGSYSTVEEVRNTFEKFRFEIEIHDKVTGEELRSVCAQFFSRDFTKYGAAAVVVLAPSDVHGNYEDQDIRHHFNRTPLPTLFGKPKILICQADNWLPRIDDITLPFSLSDLPIITDVLEMNFPAIIPQPGSGEAENWLSNLSGRPMQPDSDDVMEIYNSRANIADSLETDAERLALAPLSWFCNSLERLGDREDMLTIYKLCLNEIHEHVSPQRVPFLSESSTLLKKIKLWRNV